MYDATECVVACACALHVMITTIAYFLCCAFAIYDSLTKSTKSVMPILSSLQTRILTGDVWRSNFFELNELYYFKNFLKTFLNFVMNSSNFTAMGTMIRKHQSR